MKANSQESHLQSLDFVGFNLIILSKATNQNLN